MEDNIKFVKLYDIYGKLLTKKQQDIFEEYYLFNLSLREIADNKKISYQAVRDSINTSKELLEKFENIIEMEKMQKKLEDISLVLKNEDDITTLKNKLKTIIEK